MSVLARIRGSLRRRRGSRLAVIPFADGSWLFGAGALEGISLLLGSIDGLTVVGPVSALAFSRRTTDLESAMDASHFIGRADRQVDEFVAEVVEPIRRKYDGGAPSADVNV